MTTKTEPKRNVTVTQSDVVLNKDHQDVLSKFLGLERASRLPILAELCRVLSINQTLLRAAPLAPLRAHQIAAHESVRKDAARLYGTITELAKHHLDNLPDAAAFLEQLVEFHDQLQIGLIQMRGRPSQRGGGKKRNIAMTNQAVEHSISMFFDLNSTGSGDRPGYVTERQAFVGYCMDLIGPRIA